MSQSGSNEILIERIKAAGLRLMEHPFARRLYTILSENDARTAFLLILLAGFVIRAFVYGAGTSLWIDEAMLALNFLSRDFRGLFEPLDYVQFAPIGWMVTVDWFQRVFGGLEYSLRLWPFLTGIFALIFFVVFVRREFSVAVAIILSILLAMLPRAIEYTSEVKPYGADLFFSLLITLMAYKFLRQKNANLSAHAALFFVGIVSVFMSLPAAFVAGGVGISIFLARLQRADWSGAGAICLVCLGWFALFLALYFGLYTSQLQVNAENIQGYFLGAGKLPSTSRGPLGLVAWYSDSVYSLFAYLFERPSAIVAGLTFLLGCWAVFRKDAPKALALVLPLLIALGASGFGFYPFENRFFLFFAPQIILLIGYGLEYLLKTSLGEKKLTYAIAFVICLSPTSKTWGEITGRWAPFATEDIKPVLGELFDRYQAGDLIYVYYGAIPAFRIYQSTYGLAEAETILGLSPHKDWQCYFSDLPKILENQRVWLIFSHNQHTDGLSDQVVLERILETHGERVFIARARRAHVSLFEFDATKRAAPIDWAQAAPHPENWREDCTPYWYWPPQNSF